MTEPTEPVHLYRADPDDEDDDRMCPECDADIIGNDPHNPGCALDPDNEVARADSTSPTGYRCSCGAELNYIADYGAPGVGQHWQCKLGHDWSLVGGTFYDPRSGAHILTPEQVEMVRAEDDSQPPYRTSGWQPREAGA